MADLGLALVDGLQALALPVRKMLLPVFSTNSHAVRSSLFSIVDAMQMTDYCLNVRRMSSRLMTSMAGKTEAARMPLWMPFSAERVANPTSEGPSVPPMSPAKARRANKAVPAPGIRAEVRLMEPGHMMPTASPLIIQPARPMAG